MSNMELYGFTWPGKHEAILEAGRPTDKILRPSVEESVNFDTTENLYIEGDNLEVMKVMLKGYARKVKMIYIDPPYNTGHDFIYNDTFTQTEEEARQQFGLWDNIDAIRNFTMSHYRENSKSNPRYHSDWCSMMYPRLKVAQSLLTDDGVIFISIDDNEVTNLRMICNEIFGESNFIAQLIWQNKKGGGNDATHIAIEHEYIITYAKNITSLGELYERYSDDYAKRYCDEDDEGRFYWDTLKRKAGKQYYPITCPDGTILQYDDDGNPISWLRSQQRFDADLRKGEVRFVKTNVGWSVQFKQRMPKGKTPRSMITDKGTTSTGASELYELFKRNIFSNPKPVELIASLMEFATDSDSIVMDFFSGSSTTAHAVMNLNAQDLGSRKFIMIQLPEECSPDSEAAKAGYSTICDIGRERIRRSGNGLIGDIGFRTLRLDSTNYRDVFLSPESMTLDSLESLTDNLKPDRSPLDLLFGLVAELGLPLSLPYHAEKIDGFTLHHYGDGEIIACFDSGLTEHIITNIARLAPTRVVFRDSGFTDSRVRINLEQLLKHYAPESDITIL